MTRRRLRTALALGLQALALIALLLALASVSWLDPRSRPQVLVLLDRSDSMPQDLADRALQALQRAVLGAGGDLQALPFAARPAAAAMAEPGLDTRATDLQAALEAALARHAASPLARVVVISDGQATQGDTARGLQAVREAGLSLHWVAVGRAAPATRITQVLAPGQARVGEAVSVSVQVAGALAPGLQVGASARGPAGRVQQVAGEVAADGSATLALRADTSGPLLLDLWLQAPGAPAALARLTDAAVVDVQPAAPLLYAHGGGAALADSLQRGGWGLTRVPASALDAQADGLAGYRAVVLDDVAVADASPRFWRALDAAVRDAGLGLLVLGGERAFAGGGYPGSLLEGLLPLVSEPAALDAPVSLVFAVDKSGSMGQGSAGVDRFAMAQRAVIETARSLGERDRLGLLVFDAAPRTVLPLGPAGPGLAALQRDWQSSPRGGTRLAPALEAAVDQLAQAPPSRRMLVLVTDGFVDDTPLDALRERLKRERIDTLVLAVGPQADAAALQRLLGDAGGQVLRVNEAAELPQVMRGGFERRRARVEQGRIAVRQRQALPFAPGQLPAWPEVAAHAVTRTRPEATTGLQTERGEPLWAWQAAGRGRVMAVSSGLGPWTPQWLRWAEWPGLAGGLAGWLVGTPASATRLQVTDLDNSLQVDADGPSGDLAQRPGLGVLGPAGRRSEVAGDWLAPGRWRALLPADGPGLYTLELSTPQGPQRHLHLRRPLRESDTWGIHPALARWRAAGLVADGDPAAGLHAGAQAARGLPPDRSLIGLALGLFLAALLVDRTVAGPAPARAAWRRLADAWRQRHAR